MGTHGIVRGEGISKDLVLVYWYIDAGAKGGAWHITNLRYLGGLEALARQAK